MYAVSFSESLNHALLVFPNTLVQIASDASVECTVTLTCQYVDSGLFHLRQNLWILASAGMTANKHRGSHVEHISVSSPSS